MYSKVSMFYARKKKKKVQIAKQFVLNGDTDIERFLFSGISQWL